MIIVLFLLFILSVTASEVNSGQGNSNDESLLFPHQKEELSFLLHGAGILLGFRHWARDQPCPLSIPSSVHIAMRPF